MDRESSLQNSLGAAALLLLATDSNQLFMPGFQLSFGVLWFSTLGSAPLLKRMLPFTRLDPFLPPQLASWSQRASSKMPALVRHHLERVHCSLGSAACPSSSDIFNRSHLWP